MFIRQVKVQIVKSTFIINYQSGYADSGNK